MREYLKLNTLDDLTVYVHHLSISAFGDRIDAVGSYVMTEGGQTIVVLDEIAAIAGQIAEITRDTAP